MYCPECGVEYRAGFGECADCHVPLVAGKPDHLAPDAGDPNLELTIVLESNDPLLIGSAKSALDEAGIPYYVVGEELAIRLGPVSPFVHPWCQIQVAADREDEARAILADLTAPVADEPDPDPSE